jgi:tripartite ATP-independent transporter DctP family solute receptor
MEVIKMNTKLTFRNNVCALLSLFLITMLFLGGCSSGTKTNTEQNTDNSGQKVDSKSKDKVVIKLTHGLAPSMDDPGHWISVKFKELVEEYSDGRVKVEIYPAGQLGSEQRGFQDVQSGVVQATLLAVNNAVVFAPSLGFITLPYLFDNRDEFYKVVNNLGEEINEKMIAESGNRAIIWYESGFRNLITADRPVKSIEDANGLKIRVPKNEMMLSTFRTMGAEPTPISWGETFNALQQGVVEGVEIANLNTYNSKFYEVSNYITDLKYLMNMAVIVVNEKWLDSLPPEIQDAIIKAGKEATALGKEHIGEMEKEVLQKLIDEGMEHLGAPVGEDEFAKKAIGTWPQFYEDIGGTELLEKVLDELGRELPSN